MTRERYLRLMEEGDAAMLEDYFSNSTDLFAIVNESGSFNQVNAAWQQVLGYTPAEMVGRDFISFVHPHDLHRTTEAFANANDTGQLVTSFVNRYRHKDGSYRWLEWIGRRIVEKGVHYSAARDITAEMESRGDH